MCRKPEGWQVFIDWRWRNDNVRRAWRKAAFKGYFRKHSARGMDTFTRTNKAMVDGDSLQRPLHYSWPDMEKCPKSLVRIVEQARESYDRSMKAKMTIL